MATALSQNLPDALNSIRTRPLFVLRLQVPPYYVVGATPGAFRRIGIVLGGSFEGERLSGEVLGGGNDWQAVRKRFLPKRGTCAPNCRVPSRCQAKAPIRGSGLTNLCGWLSDLRSAPSTAYIGLECYSIAKGRTRNPRSII